jgi:hypothetical protein
MVDFARSLSYYYEVPVVDRTDSMGGSRFN